MHQPRFLKRAIIALGFVILAGLLLWRGFVSSGSRSVRLTNGRELTIRQLTYGTEHRFVTGSPGARLVSPILPKSMKARIGVQTLVQKTDAPTVVIWGEWRNEPDLRPAILRIKTNRHSRDARKAVNWVGMRYGTYAAWPMDNFPRRDAILHFEVCEWDTGWQLKPAAEFSLPNPGPKNFPEWKADPYPIVKWTNGLEFSMVNFS